jgi:hypothetical protein
VVDGRRRRCTSLTILRRVLVLVLLIVGLSACAKVTPLCDEAGSLVAAGQLSRGTEQYALARQQGEGDCAEAGLSAAGSRYVDAHVAVERGRSAEDTRDVEAATTAYRDAVTLDADNVAAREALARLKQPVPVLRAPVPAPPTPPAAQPQAGLVMALAIAAVGLLCVVAGLLAWAVWRWRRQSATRQRDAAAARERLDEVLGEVQVVKTQLATARVELTRATAAGEALQRDLDQHRKAIGDVLDAVTSARTDLGQVRDDVATSADRRATELEQHLDDVIDFLTDLVSDDGQPAHDRFVHPGS